MEKFIALGLVTLGITVAARAQEIVYYPANTVQSVIDTAQEIARFVEMINGAGADFGVPSTPATTYGVAQPITL